MNFASVRIITEDINNLISFYEKVTGATFNRYTEDFAELHTPGAMLAIGSTRTLQFFGGNDIATPASNQSVIIEFRVEDADASYENLAEFLGNNIVQPPTTMPWGNRSLLFFDPDGNLVNFFTPLSQDAKARAAGQN